MNNPYFNVYKALDNSISLKSIMDDIRGTTTDINMIFTGRVPDKYQLEQNAPLICLSNAVFMPDLRADNQTEFEKATFMLEIWAKSINDLTPIISEVDRILCLIDVESQEYGFAGEADLNLQIYWKKCVSIFLKN